MLTERFRLLDEARALVAQIENEIAEERGRELPTLPSRYGFANMNAFIKAVRRATRTSDSRGPGRRTKSAGERKWVRITDEIRMKVRKLVKDGKTAATIADQVGISLPSVHNIKKTLGLVKKRR